MNPNTFNKHSGVRTEQKSLLQSSEYQEKRTWLEVPIANLLYYPSLFAWMAWRVLQSSMLAFPSGSSTNARIHALLIVVLISSLLLRKPHPLNIALGILLAGVGYLVRMQSGDAYIFDLVIILCCSHGMDLRSVAKTCFVSILIACLACVSLSQMGLIQDYIVYRGTAIRHSLGFLYCTYLGHYYLGLVLLYLFIRNNRLAWYEYTIIIVVDILIISNTDARNPCFLVLLSLALSFFIRIGPRGFAKIIETMAAWIFPAMFCLSLFLTIAYNPNNGTWDYLNTLLTNRLQQTQTTFYEYPISLFGNSMQVNGHGLVMTESGPQTGQALKPSSSDNFVDNSWISLLLKAGLVFTAVMLVMTTCAGAWTLSANRPILAIVCIVISIHVFFDDQLATIAYTPFLFYFWDCLIYYLDQLTSKTLQNPNPGA